MAGLGFSRVLAVADRAMLDWADEEPAPRRPFLGTLCLTQWDFCGRLVVAVAPSFRVFCGRLGDSWWRLRPVLGAGPFPGSRSRKAVGFTPAEIAAFAAAAESGGWWGVPRRSGFTMIWRS